MKSRLLYVSTFLILPYPSRSRMGIFRIVITLFLSVFLVLAKTSCQALDFGNQPFKDWQRLGLYTPPKVMKELFYTIDVNQYPTNTSFDEKVKKLAHKVYQFNGAGNLISEKYIHPDGSWVSSIDYDYKNGLLVQKNIIIKSIYDASRIEDDASIFFKYDEKSRIIERKFVDNISPEMNTYETITYDEHGNILSLIETRNSGRTVIGHHFQVDANNRLILEVTRDDRHNSTIEVFHYIYEGNRLVTMEVYQKLGGWFYKDRNGELVRNEGVFDDFDYLNGDFTAIATQVLPSETRTLLYNEMGWVSKVDINYDYSKTGQQDKKYHGLSSVNSKGEGTILNRGESDLFAQSYLQYVQRTFEYDGYGNLTMRATKKFKNGTADVSEWAFEYDEKGNFIRQKEIQTTPNIRNIWVLERLYEY